MSKFFLACVMLLTSCKAKPQPQATPPVNDPGLPGPVTQIGDHLTPAFTEVSTYVHQVATQTNAAFADNKIQAMTWMKCDNPLINVTMRPERTSVTDCSARIDSDYNPRVLATFSNNWLIVVDQQGTRRVSAEEFNAAGK